MELKKRTLVKALTWQAMGLATMLGLGFLTTGSVRAAGGLALGSAVIGMVGYLVHERLWARVRWGISDGRDGR